MAEIGADHPLSKATALSLLNLIVLHASGHLDQRYDRFVAARNLMKEKPELFDFLSSAFQLGRFGSILELCEFSIRRLPSSRSNPEHLNSNWSMCSLESLA
jgi:hypothetical protein